MKYPCRDIEIATDAEVADDEEEAEDDARAAAEEAVARFRFRVVDDGFETDIVCCVDLLISHCVVGSNKKYHELFSARVLCVVV